MFISFPKEVSSIKNLKQLPLYAVVFFFQNMGEFRRPFWLLTSASVLATLLGFARVFLLGQIISDITTITLQDILGIYLPLWVAVQLLSESLDYYTRKHGEAFPSIYSDFTALRFYRTCLALNPAKLFNFSKERLMVLVGKYCGHLQEFLAGWFWGTSRRLTDLVLVLAILAYQNLTVLLINLLYIVLFLGIALNISRRFSVYAARLAEQALETSATLQSFNYNLNTVRRLGLSSFYINTARFFYGQAWERLCDCQQFHARRWFLQLNLFSFIYIGTLIFGVYQVKQGDLPLGFLVLIKWAFDVLLGILIYVIEYYVALIRQKEESLLVRRELAPLADGPDSAAALFTPPPDWDSLTLRDIQVQFTPPAGGGKLFELRIPRLDLIRGTRLGIIGASGAGKTTLLNILLNATDYNGDYSVAGQPLRGRELPPHFVTVINNSDPLFKISLRDNILLGREIATAKLTEVLEGIEAADFTKNLDTRVGSADFNLSSGQEQRIRLARGLLQQSELYLLDEPFNGIDRETKQRILSFLQRHFQDKTVVLVTHNQDELMLVQKVCELKDGTLQNLEND